MRQLPLDGDYRYRMDRIYHLSGLYSTTYHRIQQDDLFLVLMGTKTHNRPALEKIPASHSFSDANSSITKSSIW